MTDLSADIEAVSAIDAVPLILDIVCRATGMGFAAVARVTEDRWIACEVRDDIAFGLGRGGELAVETTICRAIRDSREAVLIDEVAVDGIYRGHPTPALYGFQSYISVPIVLADGTFFGTLCAIDPKPAKVDTPEVRGMFKLFAELIASHLENNWRFGEGLEKQRDVEERLRQSQKMEAVGQLTGGLAHDFNNLLTGISGSLELMHLRLAQGRTGELGRYIAAAQGASKRAASLTQRLLAFSRRQTLSPEVTDVHRLAVEMSELIGRSLGAQIRFEVLDAPGLWMVRVDQNQLENALLNLCINARDAMPDGGRLTVEAANRQLDAQSALEHDLPPGHYVSLCVRDTGQGMSPQVVAQAFEPFFTTKPIGLGTGLGLSMVHGFARHSGGCVQIDSEVGRGTAVSILFPGHRGAEVVAPARSVAFALPVGEVSGTVLVVDDEPTVRMLITDLLDEMGYGAYAASDAQGALEILGSATPIDLLVTDIGLPGTFNGRQLADAARALRPGIKVLLITGYAEDAAIGVDHLEAGMPLILKPFSVESLGVRIKQAIEH